MAEFEWNWDNRNRLQLSAYGVEDTVGPWVAGAERHEILLKPEYPGSRTIWTLYRPNRARIGITWGNGNSDPVWGIYFTCWVPKRIGRRLERGRGHLPARRRRQAPQGGGVTSAPLSPSECTFLGCECPCADDKPVCEDYETTNGTRRLMRLAAGTPCPAHGLAEPCPTCSAIVGLPG